MAKVKQRKVEDVVIPKDIPIFTGIDKYKPLPRFRGCKNC